MIPESEIVSVSVNVEQATITVDGFSVVCLFGTSAILPSGERFALFSSLTDVGSMFPTNTPEYLAATLHFAQKPTPKTLAIARMFTAATPAELLGGNPHVLTDFAAVSNGALDITIDGTLEHVSGVDLSSSSSYSQIATHLQTAIAALKTGFTVTYQAGKFILRSGTTGGTSTLTFASTPGSGTDIASLLALRSSDGGVLTQGAAAESVTQSLQNVADAFPDWYSFALVDAPVDSDIEAAAAWAVANQKIYGYVTSNGGAVNSGTTSDVGSVIQATTNDHTIGMYDATNTSPYAIVSVLASAATVDFEGTNTTKTLMFGKLPNVPTSPITLSQKHVLDAKNINYYINVGKNPMFAKGVMADGSWFDQVQGLDWLSNGIRETAFAALYGPSKVPQSDKGMAVILHRLDMFLQKGVNNGLIGPGVWNGVDVGKVVANGEYLSKGYKLMADSVDSQNQEVRNTRVGPPITIIVKGAGAIQGLNINITFEQ